MKEGYQLEFGNDKSRLIRGIAILLMVTGHALPGKVIGFAVPLFSFLVGYGYTFARERNLRHGYRRVKRLLKEYWIILFGICLPTALLFYPRPFTPVNVILGMFGLDPLLSFFSWYVYFYIFAMAAMPGISRIVDRFGWKGAGGVMLLSGALMLGAEWMQTAVPNKCWGVAYRCFRYLPIIIAGYWLARFNVFSRVRVPKGWWVVPAALMLMVGVYFARGWSYSKIIDFAWAPVFAGLTSIALAPGFMNPIRIVLTRLGLQSGNMWFLHALFITHSTKVLFGKLIGWISISFFKVVAIILLSYILGLLIDKTVEITVKYSTQLIALIRRRIATIRIS